MNRKFCLLTIIFLSLLISCSKFEGSETEVVIDDRPSAPKKDEIVIDDRTYDTSIGTDVSNSKEIQHEPTKTIGTDRSQIDASYDGFGNKTETRYFNNHPRLRFLMLRTSADGSQQIFVYGQNGQVKNMPEDMIGKAMSATADDIANSAGITQSYRAPVPNIQTRNDTPLKPLPSYNFPVQARPVQPAPAEDDTQITEPPGEKPDESSEKKSQSPSVPLGNEQ